MLNRKTASENRFFSLVPSLGSKKRKDGAVEKGVKIKTWNYKQISSYRT